MCSGVCSSEPHLQLAELARPNLFTFFTEIGHCRAGVHVVRVIKIVGHSFVIFLQKLKSFQLKIDFSSKDLNRKRNVNLLDLI